MYARVTFGTAQPGKVDEAIKIMRDSVGPAVKKKKGFKGSFFLTDRNTGKCISIALWNTEADMMADESAGYRERVAKIMPTLAGQATTEHYEVSLRG